MSFFHWATLRTEEALRNFQNKIPMKRLASQGLQSWENIAGNACSNLKSVFLYVTVTLGATVNVTVSACSLFCVFLCRPEISEELRTLILRMLDKNPDTRITLSEIKVASEQTQARRGPGSLAGQ